MVAADINNDGWMDLFVANDGLENFLLANRGRGKFEEIGLVAGVAYNSFGAARSGMGVDAADYDSDGNTDLFVANIDHEEYSLYRNQGKETFDDVALQTGVSQATRLLSGWGLKFFDFDNDGTLDLILANGHPDTMVKVHTPSVDYRMPMVLMQGTGTAFKDVSAQAGAAFSRPIAGRGLALGDFNNDGAVDVLVMVNDGPPILLRNRSGHSNHWLGLQLVGRKANIDADRRGSQLPGRQTSSAAGSNREAAAFFPLTIRGWCWAWDGQPGSIPWRCAGPNRAAAWSALRTCPCDRYITHCRG